MLQKYSTLCSAILIINMLCCSSV